MPPASLEIARLMNKESFRPKYTIIFAAFAAEEIGLFGSFDFALKEANKNEKVIMMINNDMIANCTDTPSTPWSINIITYPNSESLGQDASEACARYTSLASFTDNSLSSRSDSYPFYLNGFKPLFFIQKSLGDRYHTINDLTSACNFDFCREVVKISYSLLLDKNYQNL
jgi:Zn-dependent M28 family amino/carboxypeptidase